MQNFANCTTISEVLMFYTQKLITERSRPLSNFVILLIQYWYTHTMLYTRPFLAHYDAKHSDRFYKKTIGDIILKLVTSRIIRGLDLIWP